MVSAKRLQIALQPGGQGLKVAQVKLPGINGFEVSKSLQSQPNTANIPIIFLTTRDTDEDKLAGFEAGGLDYLTKPINMPELLARVKANMRRLEAERNRARRDLELYKSNLSENMSHELLTPVSKVLNGVDPLAHLSAKQHITLFDQPIEIIRTGAEELRWLLEYLLLINQLDDGRVGPFRQPIDLPAARSHSGYCRPNRGQVPPQKPGFYGRYPGTMAGTYPPPAIPVIA